MTLKCSEIAHKTNWQKMRRKQKKREKAKGNQANPAKKGFKSTELKRGAGKLC